MGDAADRGASVSLLRKDLKVEFISEAMSTHPNCKNYLTAYMVERGALLANLSSIFCRFISVLFREHEMKDEQARDGHR